MESRLRIRGDHRFASPRSAIWARLQDPMSIRQAIPGCVEFVALGNDTYGIIVEVGLGPIRGRVRGSVTLKNPEPEERYTLVASGEGRPGRVTGEAEITLVETAAGTELTYDAELSIRGPAARVGGRLLTASARSLARQFFDAIESQTEEACG